MSICIPARNTKSIPTCLDLLEIGDIANPNTAVTVYIKDNTLQATFVFQETSYPTGRVIIDVSDYQFADHHSYELWMTMPQEPLNNYIDFTIEGETNAIQLAALNFHEVSDNGIPFQFASVVLKAA